MNERVKSLSEQKIEKSLGITNKSADDLSDLDETNVEKMGNSDKENIEARAEQARQVKEKMEALNKLENKDFSKEMYKQLAMEGFGLLQVTKGEMEIDPSPRYVEVLATLTNAVVTATAHYQGMETTDREFEIEEKKLLIKEKHPTNLTQTIAFSGSLQELMKQIGNIDNPPTIETTVEVVKPKEIKS